MNKSIIKSCLLGLNSKEIDFDAFPKEIKPYLDFSKDSAECLLDALAMQTSFYQAGNECTKIDHISESLPICENETLEYAPESVHKALEVFFTEGHFSLKTFLPLTIKKMAQSDYIIDPKFISRVFPLLDRQLRAIKDLTLDSFGERAHWVYNLKNREKTVEKSKSYIDLSRSERTATFKTLLKNDASKALLFLEEIYEAETPTNQLNYLKTNPLHLFTADIFIFLKRYLEQLNDNKANIKLKTHHQLMCIHFPESTWTETAFDEFFSKIWTEKAFLKNRKIVDKDNLVEIYSKFGNTQIENFYPVSSILGALDQFLFFGLVSVPFSTWTKFLDVSNITFIKMVEQIKPCDSPKFNKFSFQNALVLNAIIHKDKQVAEDIFSISKFEHANEEFLALFSPENLMEKIESNIKNVKDSTIFIYDLNLDLLPLKWSNGLTKVAIEQCLENIKHNRVKLNNSLWKIGPYINDSAFDVFNNSYNPAGHSHTLTSDFEEILNIKKAFNNIEL